MNLLFVMKESSESWDVLLSESGGLEAYIKKMSMDCTYGDGTIISCAVRFYQRPITVVRAASKDNQVGNVTEFTYPGIEIGALPIYIGYQPFRKGGEEYNHYVSLTRRSATDEPLNQHSNGSSVHIDVDRTSSSAETPIPSDIGNSRKYDPNFIRLGFTKTVINSVDRPQCVLCGQVLSNEALKASKMLRHVRAKHGNVSQKPQEYFERKRDELFHQQGDIAGVSKSNVAALRASYKVCLNIAKAKKPYTSHPVFSTSFIESVKLNCWDLFR